MQAGSRCWKHTEFVVPSPSTNHDVTGFSTEEHTIPNLGEVNFTI